MNMNWSEYDDNEGDDNDSESDFKSDDDILSMVSGRESQTACCGDLR